MNCFILLLLLGCCCGNGGNRSGRTGCCCEEHRHDCGCGNGCRKDRRPGGREDGCGRRPECCEDNCRRDTTPGCREEKCCERERRCDPCREEERRDRDDCGCSQRGNDGCEGPGMIPPPWQEYPRFPHRDKNDDCCDS